VLKTWHYGIFLILVRRGALTRMKKSKSSHGFHGLLCFWNGVVHEIREIRGCFVKSRVLLSEQ